MGREKSAPGALAPGPLREEKMAGRSKSESPSHRWRRQYASLEPAR